MNTFHKEDNFMDEESDNEETIYFGGIYVIWDGIYIIHTNIFIYDKKICPNEYTADKLLLEFHRRDFQVNRFSELNETIQDFNTIELSIIDSFTFDEEESYKFIVEVLTERMEIYKKNNHEKICKTKDAYNMTDLLEALNEVVLMDDLFGSDYGDEDDVMDDLTTLTKALFF